MLRHTLAMLVLSIAAVPVLAQVHYHSDGRPWSQKARSGPDSEVPGWYYNLGVSGLRVELVETAKTHLVVRHVFPDSPAAKRVKVGDHIVGAFGKSFQEPHRNGYGMQVFGPYGPILDFANALEKALTSNGKGRLPLMLERGSRELQVELKLGKKHGSYSKTFPAKCKKTEQVLTSLLEYLEEQQRDDGSWGSPPHNLFAPLALLASGDSNYKKAIERCARFHARTTKAKDHGSLINWRYMAAGIFLSEYYLATKQKWVLAELEEIKEFLLHSQYTNVSQINPAARESHPDSVPKKDGEAHGGWGHNPGFEGYGPIAMITGQGALTLAMIKHCGIDVDRKLHDAAYDFLARATGRNGYTWYEDDVPSHSNYADMGRTGAAGLANLMSPYRDAIYKQRAQNHANCIGENPDSFPDTHGSPTMGMAFTALAANANAKDFQRLMNQNRWWFTLSRCNDGTFYYQPNRDNAGYGGDSRLAASAVTALIYSIPKKSLHLTGKPFGK
ncbi:MAG: hypothetical protein ACI85K_001730 [Hyphomicrobiaceae bacterium]|jgi:hypothetical protein